MNGGQSAASEKKRSRARRLQAGAVLAMLVVLFAGLGFLVSGAQTVHWGIILGVALSSAFFIRAPYMVLRRYHAVPLAEGAQPALREQLSVLAARAGLTEPPDIRITTRDCDVFSVATPRRATIVLGASLLERLDARHLDAVLAHEVSHIKNHDTAVMGLADLVVRLTRTMSQLGLLLVVANVGFGLFAEAPLPWSLVVALVVTPLFDRILFAGLGRSREYQADLDAATLTGDPEALIDMLLAIEATPKPKRSLLRALNPYGFAPAPSELRNHPPTAIRAERLRALA